MLALNCLLLGDFHKSHLQTSLDVFRHFFRTYAISNRCVCSAFAGSTHIERPFDVYFDTAV